MPISFYSDTHTAYAINDPSLCFDEIDMFDGPGVCTRPKGHKVDNLKEIVPEKGQFHQEAFEGWVWDDKGRTA